MYSSERGPAGDFEYPKRNISNNAYKRRRYIFIRIEVYYYYYIRAQREKQFFPFVFASSTTRPTCYMKSTPITF